VYTRKKKEGTQRELGSYLNKQKAEKAKEPADSCMRCVNCKSKYPAKQMVLR